MYVSEIACRIMREVSGHAREFYEFVLPPIDMRVDGNTLVITADMPGFAKDQISLVLRGNALSIRAKRDPKEGGTEISVQRPHSIDKMVFLPVKIPKGEERVDSASLSDGVLTVRIPVPAGKEIRID